MIEIYIANEYSETLGGRFIRGGRYSGEEFRDTLLLPRYLEALNGNKKLRIYFDGTYGYSPSFLDEAFGGLARLRKGEDTLSVMEFVSNDEPGLAGYIKGKVDKAVRDA